MSDRLRDKKDAVQALKDSRKLSEKRPEPPQPEKTLPKKSQTQKTLPKKPQTQKSPAEKSQTQKSPAGKPQMRKAPAGKTRAVDPKVVKAQAAKLLAEEARRKKKDHIMMIVTIVLAAVMVIATALVLLYNRWVKKPVLPPEPSPPASDGGPSAVIPSGAPDPTPTTGVSTGQPLAGGERRSEDFYTILIFGTDEVSGLTDTIMVASYDVTNQKATVLSIPRDTLINNYTLYPINSVYSLNGQGTTGAAALKTEVSRLVGFVPDFYVTINWELVGKMVDAIDGVEFKVPWRMKYDDPDQNLHIDLMPGLQTLNGEQAMQLVRWRQNNYGVYGGGDGSDLGRLNVQHDFLKAVLKQTLTPQNIIRIPELIRLFNENVVSDLTVENMLWFGQEAVLGGLSADDVEFLTMPVYGTDNVGGRFYGRVCPIIDQLLAIINSSLNPYVEDVTLLQLDLIQMSSDGNTLSSTTGVLKNPAAGVYTPPPSPPPATGDDPGASDPAESGPGTADPPENSPGTTASAEDDPASGRPEDPSPESGPPATDSDGPDGGDQ